MIGRRLDRLSERANEILTIAAVIGRDFTLDALKELAEDTTEGQLLDVLDEALDAKIVEELSDAHGHYQFTHALMQQTLTDELSAARTVRFHARIGEVLERIHGDDADAHAAELVPHFAEAEPILGPDKLIHYLIVAGDQALSSYGYEDALRMFRRAETATSELGTVSDELLVQILSGVVRAGSSLPSSLVERQNKWDTLRRAFDLHVSLGDESAAANLATEPVMVIGATGAEEVIQDALSLVDPESRIAGLLETRLAVAMTFGGGELERAREPLKKALDVASNHNDQSLEARALGALSQVEMLSGNPRKSVDVGMAALDLAESVDDPVIQCRQPYFIGQSLLELGEPDEAVGLLDRGVVACKRFHNYEWGGIVSQGLIRAAMLRGDLEALEEAEAFAEEFSTSIRSSFASVRSWQIAFERGVPSTTLLPLFDYMKVDYRTIPGRPDWVLAATAAALQIDPSPELLRAANDLAERHGRSASVRAPMRERMAERMLGLIAALSDDREVVEKQYPTDLSDTGRADVFLHVSVDRLLGLMANVIDKPGKSITHFEDALKFCQRAGYRPELARTCSDYAETLLVRDEPGDREKAIELQDEALAITQELGMRPLTERILARREILRA